MVKDLVPCVHFYDQDFVDMYDRTWVWIEENWIQNQDDELFSNGFFVGCKSDEINLFDNCMTSISLSYSNQSFDAYSLIDFFYKQQTEDGQIFEKYGTGILSRDIMTILGRQEEYDYSLDERAKHSLTNTISTIRTKVCYKDICSKYNY